MYTKKSLVILLLTVVGSLLLPSLQSITHSITGVAAEPPPINPTPTPTTTPTPTATTTTPISSIKPTAPKAITPGVIEIQGKSIDSLTPTLKWERVSQAKQYQIFVLSATPPALVHSVNIEGIEDSFQLPLGTLLPGKKYYWKIKVMTGLSEIWSDESNPLYFQVDPLPPQPELSSPGSVNQSTMETLDTLIPTLRWLSVVVADRYAVVIKTQESVGVYHIVYFDDDVRENSKTVPGGFLLPRKTYRWEVKAHSTVGWGNVSKQFFFKTRELSLAPKLIGSGRGNPSSPELTNNLTPKLWWQMDPGADKYLITISRAPYDAGNAVYSAEITSPYLEVPQGLLEPGKNYRWEVKAHNKLGWGDVSAPLFFQAPGLPSAPTILGPGQIDSPPQQPIGDLTPTLNWEKVPGANNYAVIIRVAPYGAGDTVYTKEFVLPPLKVPDGRLEPGKTYRWEVKAQSNIGWGSVSEQLYFKTSELPTQKSNTATSAPSPTPTLALNAGPVTMPGQVPFWPDIIFVVISVCALVALAFAAWVARHLSKTMQVIALDTQARQLEADVTKLTGEKEKLGDPKAIQTQIQTLTDRAMQAQKNAELWDGKSSTASLSYQEQLGNFQREKEVALEAIANAVDVKKYYEPLAPDGNRIKGTITKLNQIEAMAGPQVIALYEKDRLLKSIIPHFHEKEGHPLISTSEALKTPAIIHLLTTQPELLDRIKPVLELDAATQQKWKQIESVFHNQKIWEQTHQYFMAPFWFYCLQKIPRRLAEAKIQKLYGDYPSQPSDPNLWEKDFAFLLDNVFTEIQRLVENPEDYRTYVHKYSIASQDMDDVGRLVDEQIKIIFDEERVAKNRGDSELPGELAKKIRGMVEKANGNQDKTVFLHYAFIIDMNKKWNTVKGCEVAWPWAWVANPLIAYIERWFGKWLA